MPHPIIDTGLDQAIARGMSLGLQARQLQDTRLYRDDQLEARTRALDIAEQNAQTRADTAEGVNAVRMGQLDNAERALAIREQALYDKQDSAEAKREGLTQMGRRVYGDLYPAEENARTDMGPFPQGEETTPEYRADQENYASLYPDMDAGTRTSEWKSAHGLVIQRQAQRELQALESHQRDKWPGGAEDWDARHRAAWMKANSVTGSPAAYMGPTLGQQDQFDQTIGARAADRAQRANQFDRSLEARQNGSTKPSQNERALRMLTDQQLDQLMADMAKPENSWNWNAMLWAQFYAEKQRRATQPVNSGAGPAAGPAGVQPPAAMTQRAPSPAAGTVPPSAPPPAVSIPTVDPIPGETEDQYVQRVKALMQTPR